MDIKTTGEENNQNNENNEILCTANANIPMYNNDIPITNTNENGISKESIISGKLS